MIGSTLPLLSNGLRQAPDGGPPLREDEAVPMPVDISFGDFLANLNPLHHIPVVGWVYRQVTGETVNPAFRALGGFVLGGPVGAIVAAIGAIAESLFSDAPDAAAGGAVAAGASAPDRSAPPSGPQAAPAVLSAEAAPAGGEALAARLGARVHPSPGAARSPALAAGDLPREPGFAERMMRGLDAYERSLRLRSGGA
jgi:hypothetical protein